MYISILLFIAVQLLIYIIINYRSLQYKNYHNEPKNIIAIAYLNSDIKGSVLFYENQKKDNVKIKINLLGLPKNKQLGFHIHEAGDLSHGCTSACAHFNPFKTVHGGKDSKIRHVGDLGNLVTDKEGNCKMEFEDDMIKLRGYKQNIIGRSIVIHEQKDDLGKGGNEESLKTGNAGKRIACAVIGYSMKMC